MPHYEAEDGTQYAVGPEVEEWLKREDRLHIIAMLLRPGAYEYFRHLEFTYYTPDTPRNELLTLVLLRWSELEWGIVSIPLDERANAVESANATGFRLADGVPTILSSAGIERFPYEGPTMYTLEGNGGRLRDPNLVPQGPVQDV